MHAERIQEVVDIVADTTQADPPGFAPGVTGYSGQRLVHMLGRLAARGGGRRGCYVEVGVFRGLTLTTVSNMTPEKKTFGIDNFAFFDPSRENQSVVEGHIERLGLRNAQLLNLDYEDALQSLGSHIGSDLVDCYFVDGPHDYRSQIMCLLLARPHLHEDAVVVIDDCNYEHVRQATADFLAAFPDFKLVFEAYTECHPNNMTPDERSRAEAGWWNGVHVLARDDDDVLPAVMPPTRRDRSRYLDEHTRHAARFDDAFVAGTFLAEAVADLRSLRLSSAKAHLTRAFKDASDVGRSGSKDRGEFATLNTYSRHLPRQRLSAPRS